MRETIGIAMRSLLILTVLLFVLPNLLKAVTRPAKEDHALETEHVAVN